MEVPCLKREAAALPFEQEATWEGIDSPRGFVTPDKA